MHYPIKDKEQIQDNIFVNIKKPTKHGVLGLTVFIGCSNVVVSIFFVVYT
jgi:hypothetical protein